MIRRTTYQRTHRPVRVVEVLCTSRAPLTDLGYCPDCKRVLKRGGRAHKPGRTGSLGWVEQYADGSSRYVTDAERS